MTDAERDPVLGRILVVDDTPANQRLLSAILEPRGHDVVAVGDGYAALEAVADGSFDLVLCDVSMPDMNGYEVCRRIREDPRLALLPVVMITAADEEEKVRALEAGADDFIRRPFELAELLARVRSLLRVKASTDTIEGQSAELEAWSRTLEERVNEQLGELSRYRLLERFLPVTLAEALRDDGGEALLQPHRREVAVLWVALGGFNDVAESEDPEAAVELLARFHDALGQLVGPAQATVGGSTGDGVMLIFGDPLPVDEPVEVAAALALDLADRIEPTLAEWRVRGHQLAVVGGLSFGHATLGVLGFEGRYDYTAIGPVSTIAGRLVQGGHGRIVCDQRARARLGHGVMCEPVADVDFGDGVRPVQAFALRRTLAAVPTAAPERDDVQINVLGPLEVRVGGRELPISSGRERSLLAALVASRGQVVSVDALADDLWEGDPPETATSAVRVYVSRLRKALADAGLDGALVTRPPGYRLDVDDDMVDAARFEAAVARARALRPTDPAGALEEYRAALVLWRGRPLAEIADGPFAVALVAHLEEARLAATEECLEVQVAIGDHGPAVVELEGLVATHPLRERLWALRMVALSGLGRHAEALRAYQDLRTTLQDELGLEPSPALTRLERAVLDQETADAMLAAYLGRAEASTAT